MSLSRIHHYEILERLGAGSQGTVYLATDERLERPVVIKIVHEHRASDPDIRRKLLREARLASAIQHVNVCAIYEAGEYEDRPYIIMQHVPGQTLERLLEAGPLNVHLALSIGIQIASGLADAHRRRILHRDLKPANIMIAEGGVVKILDFGLARRRELDVARDAGSDARSEPAGSSSSFGTTAYMAPEQFVTHRSSELSDLYALGVILYQMVTGTHPFWVPGVAEAQIVRAIQSTTPAAPRRIRPEVPESLEGVILRAIDRQPSSRFGSASELAEALKTVMRTLDLELGTIPGESSAVLPAPMPAPKRRSGPLSTLVERLSPRGTESAPDNSIAVLPFQNLGDADLPRYYGLALSEMVATRLATISTLTVRPPSAFLGLRDAAPDPLEAARQVQARYALSGSFLRSEDGFTVNWRLSSVEERTILAGAALSIPSLDLLRIQNDISDEVVQTLHRSGIAGPRGGEGGGQTLPDAVSEEYLRARALLFRFLWSSSERDDLERAREAFESVVRQAPGFASAHAGLGITHLHSVINGFGGLSRFMAAQRHLEKAVEIDPGHREARFHRAYTYLWRGEKTEARHEIQYLLEHAGSDGEVLYGAGVVIQLDGLLDEALRLLGRALRVNPSGATRVYNRRARIYQYQGRLDLAWQEVERGLALEPRHALLRTTRGYLLFREGRYPEALDVLQGVVEDDPGRRLTIPTLAMCLVRLGDAERASELITDELLGIAAADCEMAYRLATYCVVDGNVPEALHWLRKAVYLGNENYPWLSTNPLWDPVRENEEFQRILVELRTTWERNRSRWRSFLADRWS